MPRIWDEGGGWWDLGWGFMPGGLERTGRGISENSEGPGHTSGPVHDIDRNARGDMGGYAGGGTVLGSLRSNVPIVADIEKEDVKTWKLAWQKLIDKLKDRDCAAAFGGLSKAVDALSKMRFQYGPVNTQGLEESLVKLVTNPDTGVTAINANSNFFSQKDVNGNPIQSKTGLTGDSLRAFQIMAEMGHQIPGLFKDDWNPNINDENSNKILTPCFGKKII
jgi:hypothetical protein